MLPCLKTGEDIVCAGMKMSEVYRRRQDCYELANRSEQDKYIQTLQSYTTPL